MGNFYGIKYTVMNRHNKEQRLHLSLSILLLLPPRTIIFFCVRWSVINTGYILVLCYQLPTPPHPTWEGKKYKCLFQLTLSITL